MLLIRFEIWPYGDESTKREIAQVKVGNISYTSSMSDYIVMATENASQFNNHKALDTKFEIKDHNRMQSVFALAKKIFDKLA